MKLRVLAALFAALLPAMAYAQSGTSMSDQSLYNGLPDNTNQAILPSNVRNVVASKASTFPVTSSAAAGTSCTSGATSLASSFNVITSGTGYVVATTGYTEVWNETGAPIYVCPPTTSAAFSTLSAGTPVSLDAGSSVRVSMTTSTQGYVLFQNGVPQNAANTTAINSLGVVQGPIVLLRTSPLPTGTPGAGVGWIALTKGTNAGTCKLVALAGLSSTATTILDNIGGGGLSQGGC